MGWVEDEIHFRAEYAKKRVRPALVCTCLYLSCAVYFYGPIHVSSLVISLTLLVILTAAKFMPSPSLITKKWAVFAFYEATQVLVMTASLYVCCSASAIFSLASSTVLAFSETTPLYPKPLNAVLCLKHVCGWGYVLSHGIGTDPLPHGIIPALWCCANVLLYVDMKQKSLEDIHGLLAALEAQEKRLEGVLQAIPDGIIVISEGREVIRWNDTFEQQMGVKHNHKVSFELVEALQYAQTYTKSEDLTLAEDVMHFHEFPIGTVLQFTPIIHNERYFECRGSVMQWDTRKVCVLTVRDTSHWITLEMQAKSENERKTALLRSVSHELRTPTNAILNLAIDLRQTEVFSLQGQKDVEMIISATSFLLSLINDLLDFTRIVYDSFSLMKRHFDLQQVLKECIQLILPQAYAKSINLILRFDPQLPKFVYTDSNRLKQVILNLLSNSLK